MITTDVPGPRRLRPDRSTNRLGGTARRVVLTAHILTAAGWFGIAVLVAVATVTAGVTDDATLAAALYRAVAGAIAVSVPMGLLALATGVVLGVGTTWGVLQHWWVVAKLVINVAVVATDLVVVAPAAHRALAAGTAPVPLYGSTIAHCVVLAVATALSVFKPPARTPLGRRRASRRPPGLRLEQAA
jgi:hypothetical protein